MSKTKRLSRVITVILTMLMVIALAVPTFAAGTDVVTSCYFADTSHPFAFFTAPYTSSKLINQYTTGQPISGTKLTTWSWTNDPSQWFESSIFTANGTTGNTWSVYSNQNIVMNCRRSGTSPEVDLASAVGNYRADIEILYNNLGATKLGVAPRYIHPQNMYITVGGAMSGGNYLNWTNGGTTFYQYDVGLKKFI